MGHHGLRSFVDGLVELVYPVSCFICDQPPSADESFRHGLCTFCFNAVTMDLQSACLRCGRSIGPHTRFSEKCTACLKTAYGFESVIRMGLYEGRLRDAILRMKGATGESLAERMGRVFGECRWDRFLKERCDLVVPVPLHWRRAWSRGYNQAAAVADQLAGKLGTPCQTRLLRRVRHTPQQLQPSAAARRKNVLGAFRVARGAKLGGKRILLVDDVMTTGSTASEASRTLREAGAAAVVVAVLARR